MFYGYGNHWGNLANYMHVSRYCRTSEIGVAIAQVYKGEGPLQSIVPDLSS